MALVLKLNTSNKVTSDSTKVILTDSTGVYGSVTYEEDPNNEGSYIQVTNTTGYGAPNVTRASLGLFLVAYQETSTGRVSVPIDVASYTATDWYVPITSDKVYSFYMIGVPIITDPTLLAEGDSGYIVVENKIKKKVGGLIIDIEASSLVDTKYSSAKVQQIHLTKSGTLFTELVGKRVDLSMGECSERHITSATKAIDDIEGGMYSATYQFTKGNILESVKIVDSLNSKDYSHILKL